MALNLEAIATMAAGESRLEMREVCRTHVPRMIEVIRRLRAGKSEEESAPVVAAAEAPAPKKGR